jgi:hypothetical protein
MIGNNALQAAITGPAIKPVYGVLEILSGFNLTFDTFRPTVLPLVTFPNSSISPFLGILVFTAIL